MKLTSITSNAVATAADAVVVGVWADGQLTTAASAVDQATGGLLSKLIECKEITGKALEVVTVYPSTGMSAPLVAVVGLGDKAKLNRQIAHRAAGAAALSLAKKPREKVAFFLDEQWAADLAENAVAGALVGCVGQDLYRKEKKVYPFGELLWSGQPAALSAGRILGEAMNLTRRLVNEPPQDIYPETFAQKVVEVAAACGMEVEVWDQARLEQERCGSLLAVAKGSSRPARLVIMSYLGGPKGAPPLALVGKGVTFDSGGLSLKPTDSMLTIKCDMAGAATVLGAMQAIAQLKLPVNVLGLVGLVENMTGPAAMKLGDVLHARNGRTIEVHNTDAEGRLVLADVLAVAVDRGACKIIDLATLTGACCVALGLEVAGLMTNNEEWSESVYQASLLSGEPLWKLPMFAEYGEQIRSEVADIKNVGEGRWGGAITAAKFLEEFVDGRPWVHLDIAGPAFAEKGKSWVSAGASGRFVQTLLETVRQHR